MPKPVYDEHYVVTVQIRRVYHEEEDGMVSGRSAKVRGERRVVDMLELSRKTKTYKGSLDLIKAHLDIESDGEIPDGT